MISKIAPNTRIARVDQFMICAILPPSKQPTYIEAAVTMMELTWLNMTLMLLATPGVTAPAAAATNAAISAYSTRS